jgi:hypothetical protein
LLEKNNIPFVILTNAGGKIEIERAKLMS